MSDPSFLDPVFDDDEDTPAFAHRRARLGRQAGAEHLGASPFETCGYPDSDKIMADAPNGGISHLWRMGDAVDYFEGEGSPSPPG